jgi:hypothetical protein
VNHCGCGQAIGIAYSKCVFVALGILNAMRNILKYYLIHGTIFEKKKILNIKCVYISTTAFVRNIFNSKKN